MNKKIILIMALIISIFFIFIPFYNYFYICLNHEKIIEDCQYCNNDKCIGQTFTLMLPKLLIYNAKVKGQKVKFLVYDVKHRYVSDLAAKKSQALISYGSMGEIRFENDYTNHLNRYAYIFDCGIDKVSGLNEKELFYSECIGTDKFILQGQVSSKKIHNFGDKLKELGLENKKIYLKMDIAGAEVDVIPDIMKYSDQITGINLSLHLNNPQYIIDRLKTMDEINKKFVLIARSTFNNDVTRFPMHSPFYQGYLSDHTMELSFINKNFVDSYNISLIQNTDILFRMNKNNFIAWENEPIKKNPYNDIRYAVTFTEIIREKLKKIWKKQF